MADLQSGTSNGNSLPLPQGHGLAPLTDSAADVPALDRADDLGGGDKDTVEHETSLEEDEVSKRGNSDSQINSLPSGPDPLTLKNVSEVLDSEIGVSTLLNRLKQSIASAKEFANFLKKRSQLEEDHSQSLRKLCKSSLDSSHRAEHRQGTFAIAYNEMMRIHERMAENGGQFAKSLYQMHDDLLELANSVERNRKISKQNGLAAEQKVADLETAMRKSKAKYDALAEDYDRARTGEARQGSKVFGLKGPKSAAQHEEDLLRKVQGADQTYHGHVQTLLSEKSQLETSLRPDTVRTLQDLVKETDAGIALQMQRFASCNEKLVLSNGLIITPLQDHTSTNFTSRSMRLAVASVNNEKDLSDYILSQHGNVIAKPEVKYERNPLLNPHSSPMGPQQQSSSTTSGPTGFYQGQPPVIPQGSSQSQNYGQYGQFQALPTFSMGSRSGTSGSIGTNTLISSPQDSHTHQPIGLPSSTLTSAPLSQQQHQHTFSQGNTAASSDSSKPLPLQQSQPSYQKQEISNNNTAPTQGPPQIGSMSFNGPAPPGTGAHNLSQWSDRAGVSNVSGYEPNRNGPMQGHLQASPTKPVFGLTLNSLYERDGLAVPMVVHQCMQAVNLFGLGVEGIYRQSGSKMHIENLKSMFNSNSESPKLDFRNPENFYHDVNSVTGLLKQFFRELPDPLLTSEHHDGFITAAKQEDPVVRRDSLHAIINTLPDPHYATLRAIMLHLFRIMDNSHINRMNSYNLAVIFGPTLMGTDPSIAIADAGWQIKVVDTILQNTYQIFEDD